MTRFKLARMEAGLTQLAVARAAGVSESKITRIETGRYTPGGSLRQRLAALLKCGERELFSEKRGEGADTNGHQH